MDRGIKIKPCSDSYKAIRMAWGNEEAPADFQAVKYALKTYMSDPILDSLPPRIIDFAYHTDNQENDDDSGPPKVFGQYPESYGLNDHLRLLNIKFDPKNKHYILLRDAWYDPRVDIEEEKELWNNYMISYAISEYYKAGDLKELPAHLPAHPFYSFVDKPQFPFQADVLIKHLTDMDTSLTPFTQDEQKMVRQMMGITEEMLMDLKIDPEATPRAATSATPNEEGTAPTTDPWCILDEYPDYVPYNPDGWVKPEDSDFQEFRFIDQWGPMVTDAPWPDQPPSPSSTTRATYNSSPKESEAPLPDNGDTSAFLLCEVLDRASEANQDDQGGPPSFFSSYFRTPSPLPDDTIYTGIMEGPDGMVTFIEVHSGRPNTPNFDHLPSDTQ